MPRRCAAGFRVSIECRHAGGEVSLVVPDDNLALSRRQGVWRVAEAVLVLMDRLATRGSRGELPAPRVATTLCDDFEQWAARFMEHYGLPSSSLRSHTSDVALKLLRNEYPNSFRSMKNDCVLCPDVPDSETGNKAKYKRLSATHGALTARLVGRWTDKK